MARHEAPQDALGRLIEALRVLPGVGPKSAQRMAFYLLQHDRNGAAVLAQSLGEAVGMVWVRVRFILIICSLVP